MNQRVPSQQAHGFDVLRAVACLFVVVGHIRALVLVDYQDQTNHSFLTATVYALTGLGEQAVIVFFVLSGYWVGGSAFVKWSAGQFLLAPYLIARITRIYVVLVPALALSLVPLALGLFRAALDTSSGIGSLVVGSSSESLPTTLATLASLQPNLVNAPPGNSALWSLGFEFQTYILFGLVLLIVSTSASVITRLVCGVLAVGLLLVLGPVGISYALAWMLGVGIRLLPTNRPVSTLWLPAISILTLVAAIADSTGRLGLLGRLAVAATASILVYFLASNETSCKSSRSRKAKMGLSLVGLWSFSLYAAHMPILLSLVLLVGVEREMDLLRASAFGTALLVSAMSLAYVFYLLTERNTPAVRRLATSWLLRNRADR